jgi:restriction endonuclease Mrr
VARRSNKASRRSDQRLIAWGLAGLVVFAIALTLATHPWMIAVLVVLVAAWGYWRWWLRPRRQAEHARAELVAAQDAERIRDAQAREELRERSLTLGGLLSLTSREFEARICDILSDHGYEDIEHVGRTGDLGIDIFATDPNGERVGIQCKRYAPDRLVPAPDVRLLYGDMTHAEVRGVFVTTSGYTADARSYADSHGINLIDGRRLAQLISASSSDG